jgi:hypothetical protein
MAAAASCSAASVCVTGLAVSGVISILIIGGL